MKTKPKKVLLVDDDEIQLLYYKEVLQDLGYDSRTLTNADNVLPTIKHYDPDLLILDLQMPLDGVFDEDAGYKILKKIKSEVDLNHLTVIICSSENSLSLQLKRILRDECNDFLVKPVKRQTLENKIKTYAWLGYINKEHKRVNAEYKKLKKGKKWYEQLLY